MAFLSALFASQISPLGSLDCGVAGFTFSMHSPLDAAPYQSWPDAYRAIVVSGGGRWAEMRYELVEHCFGDAGRNRYDEF